MKIQYACDIRLRVWQLQLIFCAKAQPELLYCVYGYKMNFKLSLLLNSKTFSTIVLLLIASLKFPQN